MDDDLILKNPCTATSYDSRSESPYWWCYVRLLTFCGVVRCPLGFRILGAAGRRAGLGMSQVERIGLSTEDMEGGGLVGGMWGGGGGGKVVKGGGRCVLVGGGGYEGGEVAGMSHWRKLCSTE